MTRDERVSNYALLNTLTRSLDSLRQEQSDLNDLIERHEKDLKPLQEWFNTLTQAEREELCPYTPRKETPR